ncbi:hypothetical protein WJX72_003285 [[Myrmecia] bisecta]|uniref:E3 ubiquitin-protein ligase n=1 Tax=[Myrmecia] bisecta TaxID=41462 RepID=A0AAW1PIS1_9CHLO
MEGTPGGAAALAGRGQGRPGVEPEAAQPGSGDTLKTFFQGAEHLFCSCRPGCSTMQGYLDSLQAETKGRRGPCTAVWRAGAIAYRCKTCQTSQSSAVCLSCFKGGGHENHDYTMYISESGGCCDCGDPTSWKPEGFCPQHNAETAATPEDVLGEREGQALRMVLSVALVGLPNAFGARGAADDAAQLLEWLEPLCGNAAVRKIAVSVLDVIIGQLVHLDEGLLHEATTLLLLLLYEPSFKYRCAQVFLRHYRSISLQRDKARRAQLQVALDRITVQLLNTPDVSLQLVRDDDILGVLFGTLHQMLMHASVFCEARRLLCVYPKHELIKERAYLRVVADLRMVLLHADAAAHLLLRCQLLFQDKVLGCLALLHGMAQHRRKMGSHVEYEDQSWIHAVHLEVLLQFHVLNPMLQMLTAAAVEHDCGSADSPSIYLQALLAGLRMSSEKATAKVKARDLATARVKATIFDELIAGAPVTAHLPLHRAAAGFARAILTVVQSRSAAGRAPARAEEPPAWDALSASLVRTVATSTDWGLLSHDPLQLLAWMAQMRARIWLRNGEELVKLHDAYYSAMWSEEGLDLDVALLQCWLRKETPEKAIAGVLEPFGALPFLQAARLGMPVSSRPNRYSGHQPLTAGAPDFLLNHQQPGAAPADPNSTPNPDNGLRRANSDSEWPEQRTWEEMLDPDWDLKNEVPEGQLGCVVDGLRLLVTLLRDRSLYEQDTKVRLRRELVHWLAARDVGYTHLQACVPRELANDGSFDAVLEDVADFVNPNLQQKGKYKLKPALWAEFDPFFLHYTHRDLHDAVLRALRSGQWKAHQQLLRPVGGQAGLPAAFGILSSPLLLRLIWSVLRYAMQHPSTRSDDLAVAALNLLALAMKVILSPTSSSSSAPINAPTTLSSAPSACQIGGGATKADLQALADGLEGRPGLLQLLQTLSATGQHGSAATTQTGSELRDCAEYMAQKLRDVVADGEPPAAAAPSPPSAKRPASREAEGAESASQAQERRVKAKARQAEMMARMQAQQAAFTATAAPRDEGPGDAGGAQDWDSLPGECALCQCGNETAPLGLVAQVHCCNVPSLALRAPPALHGLPKGAKGRSSQQAQHGVHWPSVSSLDSRTGLHLLCCGHLLHQDCLKTYREGLSRREAADHMYDGVGVIMAADAEAGGDAHRKLREGGAVATLLQEVEAIVQRQCRSRQASTSSGATPRPRSAARRNGVLVSGSSVGQQRLGSRHALTAEFLTDCRRVLLTQLARQQRTQPSSISQGGEEPSGDVDMPNLSPEAAYQTVTAAAAAMGMHLPATLAIAPNARSAEGHGPTSQGGSAAGASARSNLANAPEGALLWSVLAHNVAHWEVQHRDARPAGGSDGSDVVDAAHWRGLRNLAELCALHGSGAVFPLADFLRVMATALFKWLCAAEAPGDGVAKLVVGSDPISGFGNVLLPSLHSIHEPAPPASARQQPDPDGASMSTDTILERSERLSAQAAAMRAAADEGSHERVLAMTAEFNEEAIQSMLASQHALSRAAPSPHLVSPDYGRFDPAELGLPDTPELRAEHAAAVDEARTFLLTQIARLRPEGFGAVMMALMEAEVEVAPLLVPQTSAPAAIRETLARFRAVAAQQGQQGQHALFRAVAAQQGQQAQHAQQPQQQRMAAANEREASGGAAANQRVAGGDAGGSGDPHMVQAEHSDADGSSEDASGSGNEDGQGYSDPFASHAEDGQAGSAADAAEEDADVAASGWAALVADPYALLLQLFALVMNGNGVLTPAEVYLALLKLVYTIASTQAAVLAVLPLTPVFGSTEEGLGPWTAASRLTAYRLAVRLVGDKWKDRHSRAHKQGLLESASRQLLPFLRRAQVLLSLLQDSLPPALASPKALAPSAASIQADHAKVSQGVLMPAGLPAGPRLVALPDLYQDLYLHFAEAVCDSCGAEPTEPVLCLLCGAFTCCSDQQCRAAAGGAGPCFAHAAHCGGGTGLFLLTKGTKLLLLSQSRGALEASPYLDAHGEEDSYLRRGRPLHLSRARLERIARLQAASAFDFDTVILHKSRGGVSARGAQWY